jgi:hypothetical protein
VLGCPVKSGRLHFPHLGRSRNRSSGIRFGDWQLTHTTMEEELLISGKITMNRARSRVSGAILRHCLSHRRQSYGAQFGQLTPPLPQRIFRPLQTEKS